MRKKIVFLPYDMDTAIGINNEGALVFSYNLEDIDQTEGGADVFNGQQSVLWKNMRAAFFDEMKAMYQTLRSTGALSYEKTERMFEEHQAKWPEAIFNEDAWFKYLAPLVEKGNASYLSMLQGSKAEQRKWWLYNRFRYLDSKYNAGDALSDVITVRGYAKADITVEPYADVYASVKYGSYLVQSRSARNTKTTLPCPLDNVNDTEIYIYSASQLADVGDLSGLKVGYADFSKALKLQNLKIGDSNATYSNGNLTELYLGNNVLLRKINVRNCPNLTQSIDISGCSNIEEVYFDGTAITGLTLPNGGILKKLHVPDTLTNLTIRNQKLLTEFQMSSYSALSTVRIENAGLAVNTRAILTGIAAGSRVRMIGFDWTVQSIDDIYDLLDVMDTMRGLDENGNNVDKAQMSGVIHLAELTGAEYAAVKDRYPDITIAYEHITSQLFYYTFDGSELLYTETVQDAGEGKYAGTPTRESTAQYTYTFAGWSRQMDSSSADANARKGVDADRSVYAAYARTIRKYTVYFYNGYSRLQTVQNVPYGGSAAYTGSTPVSPDGPAEEYPFLGWEPEPKNITGDTNCYAKFGSPYVLKELSDTWAEIIASMDDGTYKERYSVGNYLSITAGTETYHAQIVGFDADPLSSGSGNAKMSFILRERLKNTGYAYNPNDAQTVTDAQGNTSYVMGTGAIGGWGYSQRRTVLQSTFFNSLPANVRSRIATVNKNYTYIGTDGGNIQKGVSQDTIWLADVGEMAQSSTNRLYNAWTNVEGTNEMLKEKYQMSQYDSTVSDYAACRSAAKKGMRNTTGYLKTNGSGQGWNDGNGQNGGFGLIVGFCLN